MQVRIISKDYQKITDAIKTQINRGVTLYHIAGGYTGEESCEVMTIPDLQGVKRAQRSGQRSIPRPL